MEKSGSAGGPVPQTTIGKSGSTIHPRIPSAFDSSFPPMINRSNSRSKTQRTRNNFDQGRSNTGANGPVGAGSFLAARGDDFDVRRGLSVLFVPSVLSPSADDKETCGASPQTCGASKRTCGASAQTCGASARTCGASARTCGASAQTGGASARPCGASARTCGVSAQTCGVSAQTCGVSAQTCGVSAQTC